MRQGGTRGAVGALVVVLTALVEGGCADAAPASGATSSRAVLAVTCTPEGVVVDGDGVVVGPGGPVLEVSSTAEPGTYLNLRWPGGGQGDAAPTDAARWHPEVPPGRLELACGPDAFDGRVAAVTVEDPDRLWRPATLADLGCGDGGTPSWVVDPVAASSPRAALAELLAQMESVGGGVFTVPSEPAPVGYPEAPTQTWIVSDEGGPPSFVALVRAVDDGSGLYAASPDRLCA